MFVSILLVGLIYTTAGYPARETRSDEDKTYPPGDLKETSNDATYRIAIIADLDKNSKSEQEDYEWKSYLQRGFLTINSDHDRISVEWDDKAVQLTSGYSLKGRGMEFSELCLFDGNLLTVDDKTGVVFNITENNTVVPWVILSDGNGQVTKGFKGEWMTVKDGEMWVGGLGLEMLTPTGEVDNYDLLWVKRISPEGVVHHVDWRRNFTALMDAANLTRPGYILHESCVWSDIHKSWFFLPRKASTQSYHYLTDEHKGTNLMFRASEDFSQISVTHIGPLNPTHGFSTFKFVPNTQDSVVVALKSVEVDDTVASYIMAFTLDNKIILPETKIGDDKYEGIEFI